jgi:hypothetical protein
MSKVGGKERSQRQRGNRKSILRFDSDVIVELFDAVGLEMRMKLTMKRIIS